MGSATALGLNLLSINTLLTQAINQVTGERKASGPRLELLHGESFALFLPVCLKPVECCLCVGGMLAQAGDSVNQVTLLLLCQRQRELVLCPQKSA